MPRPNTNRPDAYTTIRMVWSSWLSFKETLRPCGRVPLPCVSDRGCEPARRRGAVNSRPAPAAAPPVLAV